LNCKDLRIGIIGFDRFWTFIFFDKFSNLKIFGIVSQNLYTVSTHLKSIFQSYWHYIWYGISEFISHSGTIKSCLLWLYFFNKPLYFFDHLLAF